MGIVDANASMLAHWLFSNVARAGWSMSKAYHIYSHTVYNADVLQWAL